RTRDRGVSGDEHQYLAVGVVPGQILQGRHVGQLGIPLHADLGQDEDLLLGEPLRTGRLPRGPRVRAAAADLAPLHGQIDVVAAWVAGDDLKLGADKLIERVRIKIGAAGDAGRADHELALHHVLDGADSGRVPRIDDVGRVGGVADPVELANVVYDAGSAGRLV